MALRCRCTFLSCKGPNRHTEGSLEAHEGPGPGQDGPLPGAAGTSGAPNPYWHGQDSAVKVLSSLAAAKDPYGHGHRPGPYHGEIVQGQARELFGTAFEAICRR